MIGSHRIAVNRSLPAPTCYMDARVRISALSLDFSSRNSRSRMTKITDEAALATIFDKGNKRRKIWTPTILLDRMGISRSPVPYSNYDKQSLRKAKKVLHELWLQRKLLRKTKPDTRNRHLAGAEIAYVRPSDAPDEFLVPRRICQQPCLTDVDADLVCEPCGTR